MPSPPPALLRAWNRRHSRWTSSARNGVSSQYWFTRFLDSLCDIGHTRYCLTMSDAACRGIISKPSSVPSRGMPHAYDRKAPETQRVVSFVCTAASCTDRPVGTMEVRLSECASPSSSSLNHLLRSCCHGMLYRVAKTPCGCAPQKDAVQQLCANMCVSCILAPHHGPCPRQIRHAVQNHVLISAPHLFSCDRRTLSQRVATYNQRLVGENDALAEDVRCSVLPLAAC